MDTTKMFDSHREEKRDQSSKVPNFIVLGQTMYEKRTTKFLPTWGPLVLKFTNRGTDVQ